MNGTAAEFDGLAVHVSPAEGEGVLWIHGYTLDSTVWQELWAALPGWRHIGVDLPGHGRSRALRPKERLPQLGRAIADLAAEFGARHLAGMSFGGMVAIQTAVESPTPFKTLSLGSPALGGGPTDPDAATKNLRLIHLFKERGAGPWMRDLWMQWPPDIFRGAARVPHLWERLVEVVGRHEWTEMRELNMDALTGHKQVAQLSAIMCPTLVVVGEEDMAAFKRSAELIQRSVPNCRRVYVPGTGHLSLLEHVSQVAPVLRAHLESARETFN